MDKQPNLTTARLTLRPLTLDDAPRVRELAGDRAVAQTTLNIPHPYPAGRAESWIKTHLTLFEKREQVVFGITLTESDTLIGCVGLTLDFEHERAEIGYWIGVPYWNQGYCTEASRAVLRYGFEQLDLRRIHANYLSRNQASGRVMEKLGMSYEGCFRQHIRKWGRFEDLTYYAILRDEFNCDDDSVKD